MMRMVALLPLLWAGYVPAAPAEVMPVLETLHKRHHFPGASVAWVGPGEEQHALAIGFADPERQLPMTTESRMLAASIGKTFVAAAILSACTQGALDLDAPLSTWLGDRPWFARLPNHDHLTLRNLLNHSAGLPDHIYHPGFAALFQSAREAAEPPSAQELVALILDAPARFPAGEGWAYSDTGYLLAAMALEASLKKTWVEIVEERFIKPLGLRDTQASDHRVIQRLAVGVTAPDNDLGLPVHTVDKTGRLVWHPGIEGAGGGLVSSAPDLARWGRALWSGRVFDAAATRELLTGVPVDPAAPAVRYGLGVLVEPEGAHGEVRGHRGWIPGYVSSLRYYPAYDIAIAIQVNTDAGMMGDDGVFIALDAALTDAILATADRQTPLPAGSD